MRLPLYRILAPYKLFVFLGVLQRERILSFSRNRGRLLRRGWLAFFFDSTGNPGTVLSACHFLCHF